MQKPRITKAGTYQARYTTETGNRRSAGTFSTIEEAERAAKKAVKRKDGEFRDYAEHYLKVRRGEVTTETWKEYERLLRLHVLPTFGTMRLKDVCTSEVRIWVNNFSSPSTRRNAYNVLSSLMKLAFADGRIDRPFAPVRGGTTIVRVKEKRFYSAGEVHSVLDLMPERYRLIALVQFATSARISEVLGLNWDKIDLASGRVEIVAQFFKGQQVNRVKHRSEGVVWLADWAIDLLRKHKAKNPAIGSSPVFVNQWGRRQGPKEFREAWSKARTEAGLSDIVPHDLRHTGLTLFHLEQGDITVTMKRARHKDPRSTYGYVKVGNERPAAMDAFSARTRPKKRPA